MADKELGKLSHEQIQKLANTISEARSLTSQQEEIITRVLEGETEIGNLRISSLERYFDSYSRNLDLVARKHSSLNDAFLVLDGKLTENYKTLSSDMAKLERQLLNAAKDASKAAKGTAGDANKRQDSSQKPQDSSKPLAGFDNETATAIKQIAKALTARKDPSGIIGYTPSDNNVGGIANENGKVPSTNQPTIEQTVTPLASATTPVPEQAVEPEAPIAPTIQVQASQPVIPDTVDVSETINSEALRATLQIKDTSIEDLIANYSKYTKEISKAREALNELNAASESGDQERIKAAEDSYNSIAIKYKAHLEALQAKKEKYLKDIAKQEEDIENKQLNLELARLQTQEMQAARLTEFRLKELDKVLDAEQAAQDFANQLAAEIAFANSPEAAEFDTRKIRAEETEALAKKELEIAKGIAEKKAKYIVEAEEKARRKAKNEDEFKAAKARIKKEADERYKVEKANIEKLAKERIEKEEKEKKKQRAQKGDAAVHAAVSGPLTKENSLVDRFKALDKLTRDENGEKIAGANLVVAIKALSDLAKQLEDKIDEIAKHKGSIDTRLQGSNNEKSAGSYWDQLVKDMTSVGAVTPYFKQEDFAKNIESLVDRGIAFDLKQRAFLMTIQEKIANTFNVADGTLLRLIRIQQEDSTAGRLGMESALNSFLNNMYENTEYLKTVAEGVRSSLQEMEALMTGAEATEVEYQVQKWMGSLYSVGMSQEAVQGIAGALGQIAAGQVDALTSGSGAGNLLVMAANEAGLPISDILTNGLNAQETNKLLQATVNYLAELAESSKDNNVVQQQLANVFGVKASDLRAATNLASKGSTEDIYGQYMTYNNMLRQLNTMAGTMAMRTSLGEMMSNVWANGQYTLAGSMASNPISYLTYKMASLLDSAAGGIALPAISVAGFGVDLETTVADLMRVASVGTGILGSLGPMISGLASSFSGQAMLNKMGISRGSGLQVTPRGEGIGGGGLDNLGGGTKTTSGSGYVGNASGSDIKDSTIQESEDTKKQHMIEAKEEAEETQIDFINTNVLKIYELLEDVASGKRNLSVKVSGYGLTKLNNSTSLGSAQGGVAGLLSNNAANNSSGMPSSEGLDNGSSTGGFSTGSGGASSSFIGTGVELGGWTTY